MDRTRLKERQVKYFCGTGPEQRRASELSAEGDQLQQRQSSEKVLGQKELMLLESADLVRLKLFIRMVK